MSVFLTGTDTGVGKTLVALYRVAALGKAVAAVKKLAGGFEALGGGILDSHGTLYFVDRIFQRIYAWTQDRGLRIVSSHPLDPVNLALDFVLERLLKITEGVQVLQLDARAELMAAASYGARTSASARSIRA